MARRRRNLDSRRVLPGRLPLGNSSLDFRVAARLYAQLDACFADASALALQGLCFHAAMKAACGVGGDRPGREGARPLCCRSGKASSLLCAPEGGFARVGLRGYTRRDRTRKLVHLYLTEHAVADSNVSN